MLLLPFIKTMSIEALEGHSKQGSHLSPVTVSWTLTVYICLSSKMYNEMLWWAA